VTTVAGPHRKRRAYAARVPAAQRRTELLDAALHLVVTAGHSAVTMDGVAEQAGVTKPVVYGVFSGRADLLDALLRREQEQALAQLAAILPDPLAPPAGAGRGGADSGGADSGGADSGGADPGELLARVLADFLHAVRRTPDRWHCVVMPMPDLPAEFHAAREQARAMTLARAEEMAARFLSATGASPELGADIVAHTVVTLFEMAARLVLTDPDRFDPDRFAAALRAAVALTRRG